MILNEIVSHKRDAFRRLTSIHPPEGLIEELKDKIKTIPPPRDFLKALAGEDIRIIAEIKKASPSCGVIRDNFEPTSIAGVYENNGAAAISVLTEEKYFQGDINYIKGVKDKVAIPVLRKDFIIEDYDVYESRVYGADCILLIVRILEEDRLRRLIELTQSLGMEALVEVHSEEELERVISLGARLIGINNRDLDTLGVDINTTLHLMEKVPGDRIVVSESGVSSHGDILLLKMVGVAGFLVGEALMREVDIGKKLRELRGVG
jgi:indole-3-glycerol phosphate synthase